MRWKLYISTLFTSIKEWFGFFCMAFLLVRSIQCFIDGNLFDSALILSFVFYFIENRFGGRND